MLSGGQDPWHPWKLTTQQLRSILESNFFDVKVTEEHSLLETKAIDDYDVILCDHLGGLRPDLMDGLIHFVKNGRGLVTIHASILGYEVSGGEWVTGMTSHDEFGVFTVHITDKEHPITKGINSFDICDELWYNLRLNPDIHVIAVTNPKYNLAVFIPPEKSKEFLESACERNKGEPYPVAWTRKLGEGRVFHTTLGHTVSPMYNIGFIQLIINATKWAGER